MNNILFGIIFIVPIVSGIITFIYIKQTGNSLATCSFALLLAIAIFMGFLILLTSEQYVEKSASWIFSGIFVLAFLISFLILLFHSWRTKDKALGANLGLIPLYALSWGILIFTRTNELPFFESTQFILFGFLTTLLFPLSFLLRSANYFLSKQGKVAINSLNIAFLVFIFILTVWGPQMSYVFPRQVTGF